MQERVREPVCGRACVSLLLTVTNPYRCQTLQDGHVRVRPDEGGCMLRVPHEMAWVVCSACSKEGDGLRACERCHRAFYCGTSRAAAAVYYRCSIRRL